MSIRPDPDILDTIRAFLETHAYPERDHLDHLKAVAASARITLDTVKAEIAKFEKLQTRYREAGADDSEPAAVFHQILARAFRKCEYTIPTSPRGWELYSEAPSVDHVARKLSEQAVRCVEVVQAVGETPELRRYLRDYCDRVNWVDR